MKNLLFEFEEEKMPPAVILATAILIAVFLLGIAYQLLLLVL
ncbi:hypothetical protein [Natronobeatus ordinarius]|nr:hypothetical protein [Natronobeatus ordinarius]